MKTISEHAVMGRINRKLASSEMVLRKARPRFAFDLGDFYTVDADRRFIIDRHVDLEQLGREVGALAPSETLG